MVFHFSFLVFLCLFSFRQEWVNALSLLLIGDSVDRFITEDWCTFRSLGVKSDKYNTYDTM